VPAADAAPSAPTAVPPAATTGRPERKPGVAAGRSARKSAAKPTAPPTTAAEPAPAAPPTEGQLQLAITPWGNVEVDGRPMGITPPLARLTLPVGTHRVVVRNGDFPVHSASVTVSEDKPVTLRHRFE
jgi:serine/threonine-protein kinase